MSETIDRVYTIHEDELRTGWALATIYEVVGKKGIFVDGDWVESKDQDPNGDVRLIQLADIGDGEYRNKSARFLTYEKALELGCTFLQKGDILIARMPDPLGRACIFPGDQKKAVTAVDVAIVRPGDNKFNNRWLMHFANAPAFRAAVASMQSGSTRKRISRKNLARIVLPVPPRKQQDQIVDEVEKHFSRLDEAVASLKRAKVNLRRYKAAVLKAAVEGKLTEQWRKEHLDVEPASKLLDRILTERRRKFEQVELFRTGAKDNKQKCNKGKAKYREPASPNHTSLPPLPEGWCWSSTDQLLWFVTSGSRGWAKYYSDRGAIFLRIGNLDHDTITLDLKDIQRVDPPENAEGTRTKVEANDILISITADVGMAAVVPDGFGDAYINQHISLARPVNVIDAPYLGWYLATRPGQKQFRELQRGATKAGLGLDDIRSINIPLPPLEEQKEIVSQIEQRLSIVNELDQDLDANFRRVGRLRQSILKKAFAGELVIQKTNQKLGTVI